MGRIWASIALAVTIGTAACAPDAPPTAQAGARSETPEAIRLGTSRAALTATLPRILWQDDFAGNCVCGTGYSGFSAQTPKSFADPVPAGNCVTGVQVDFGGTGCGSSPDFFVNGADLGTTGVPNSCNCGNCDAATVTFTNPAGIPGYVYGGTNSLTFTDSGGGYALSYTDLTLTYGPGASATTTTLASGSNPSVFGQSVALTAHVASGGDRSHDGRAFVQGCLRHERLSLCVEQLGRVRADGQQVGDHDRRRLDGQSDDCRR
jgi:hypothetical protein